MSNLENLSDQELLELEDRLLLLDEVPSGVYIQERRWKGGRPLIFLLTIPLWVLLLKGIAALNLNPRRESNPLLIIPYLGSLFVAMLLAMWIWKLIGLRARTALRAMLHYWPVTLYLGLSLLRFVR
ncbi:MAG: hypothetical protein NDJ89_14840 [Oligoflexia bacterium]|nr:hypothetical protein [Oligoflexia bacterium]